MRNIRRLKDSLNIGASSQECIDEVRVFESHLTEHSQTLEFVGAKDVSVRKMANPKAAHSLVIYTKSSANDLMAYLITRKSIPTEYIEEEMIHDNEKFQIGLIGNLPVIKVPPGPS